MAGANFTDTLNLFRILYVDDDLSFLEVSQKILTDMDCRFEIGMARCVEDAMKKLEEEQFDVVVSDYEMPGKNGLDFLKKFKEKKIGLPFILFTGKGREEVAIQALNLGADGYYNKQGDPETVYGELAHGIKSAVISNKTKVALNESEEKFEKTFNFSTVGITVFDLVGDKFVDCNQCFERLSGYRREEIIGKHPFDLNLYKQRSDRDQLMCVLLHDGHAEKKGLELLNKSGETVAVDASFVVVEINGKPHFISNLIDSTEKNNAEKAVLRAKEDWERTFDNVPDYIAILDNNHKITRVNQPMAKQLGVTPEQAIGLYCYECVHGMHQPSDSCPYAQTMADGKEHIAEVHEPRLGGDFIVSTTPLKDANGNMIGSVHVARNITERKQAEEALAKSEFQHRLLANSAPHVIWQMNVDGNVTYVSPSVFQLRGYTPEEVRKQSITEALTPKSAQIILEALKRFHETGEIPSHGFELEQPCKNGSTVWTEANFTVLRNKSGEPESIIGVSRDITDRKKMEDALCKSRDEYRQLVDNVQAGIWVIDKETKTTFVNSNMAKMLGYTQEEIVGKHLSLFMDQDDADIPYKMLENHTDGDLSVSSYDLEFRAKSGKKVYATLETKPLLDKEGHFKELMGTVTPGTKGKGLDGTLREGEDRLYLALKNTPSELVEDSSEQNLDELREKFALLESVGENIDAGLAIIDEDYRVVWANKMLRHLVTDDQKHCYQTFNQVEAVCPDCGVKKVLEQNAQVDIHEFKSTNSNGETFWVELRVTPIKDEAGRVIAVLELAIPITERKKAEEELKLSHSKLEAMNEKLQVVGSLTRHDVKNKLMTARSNIYLLKKKAKNRRDLIKYIEGIELAINQSDKLFEFSRLYQKIGVEELTQINVADCFNQAASLIQDIQLEIINQTSGLTVLADTMLRQLFYTLIDNSLRHGKKVTQIRLHYTQNDKKITLFYEDNGVGIPEENKAKIFSEGFTTGSGSGLGLKLVKKMIQTYGWAIQEDGVPGEGVKFSIFIPKTNVRP